MSEPILEAKGIHYRYPCGKTALAGLDMRVTCHHRIAVLGANGSGKTTLFLCLNGTFRPQAGNILLEGKPVGYGRRDLIDWRRRVGLVFQDPEDQVVAGTVMQDVALGPLNLGLSPEDARARVHETLKAMGIEDFKDRPTHELSHGERKMVAIAGVLVMRPEVIILDEPIAGLDPAGAWQVLNVLDAIHRQGATLIISTHDMDLAFEWADEVVILAHGRTCRQGPVDQLFADRDMIKTARLQEPWILETTRRLRTAGLLAANGPCPRSRKEFLDQLDA